MAPDTSSAPAATSPVVWAAAAALAAPSVEPRFVKSEAAAAKASGPTITNDIWYLPMRNDLDVSSRTGGSPIPQQGNRQVQTLLVIRVTCLAIRQNNIHAFALACGAGERCKSSDVGGVWTLWGWGVLSAPVGLRTLRIEGGSSPASGSPAAASSSSVGSRKETSPA